MLYFSFDYSQLHWVSSFWNWRGSVFKSKGCDASTCVTVFIPPLFKKGFVKRTKIVAFRFSQKKNKGDAMQWQLKMKKFSITFKRKTEEILRNIMTHQVTFILINEIWYLMKERRQNNSITFCYTLVCQQVPLRSITEQTEANRLFFFEIQLL